MKILKIILTLFVLSISSSLFAVDYIYLKLMPSRGISNVTLTIIEMRDMNSGAWVRYAKIPGFPLNVVVNYLIEGHKYEFRVILASQYGEGKPSKPTKLIQISKDPYWIEVYCNPPFMPRMSAKTTAPETNITYSGLFGATNEKATKVPFKAKE